MARRSTSLILALAASLAVGLPAGAAQAKAADPPLAKAAGGDAPALSPAIVGVPLARAEAALGQAADAISASDGASAIAPLTSARRYMIRAQNGAKYLIANMPPAPPAEDRSLQRKQAQKFVRLARKAIRDRRDGGAHRSWIMARASGGAVGPAIADTPTAVFGVFTSQYNIATTAAGLLPDVTGELATRVEKTLDTSIILRNRLVQIVHNAAPPAPPAEDRSARMAQDDVVTFDTVMPGLTVLLGDEIQQFTALGQDPSIPAGSTAALTDALAADQQILTMVNTFWPPVVDD